MASYIINVTTPGGVEGTITQAVDIGFQYSDMLNSLNEGEIKISGSSPELRTLLVQGAIVEILRNGSREFYGILGKKDILDGGGLSFQILGYEFKMAKEDRAYSNSPWTSTATEDIADDIIGESSFWSAGTHDSGPSIDFRAIISDSLLSSLSNLARKAAQDIDKDYTNLEISLVDHKGSSTSVASFNDGITITNLRHTQAYPQGNKVIVYGKGDGDNQIISEYPSHGRDATSQSTYGVIFRPVYDRTILSVTEANALADAEVAISKDPTDIYDFEVLNPGQDLEVGDVITLTSQDKGLDAEEVRIVGIIRGMRQGTEFLTLQVTNQAYSQLVRNRNDILSKFEKAQKDEATYMQGSGNTLTFGGIINGKSGAPLTVVFPLSSDFITDEAGNIRVQSFTLDYDVDPYRAQYGDATFTGSDPQVQNSSANTQPNVSGSSGSEQLMELIDTDSGSEGVSDSSYDLITSVSVSGSYEWLIAKVSTEVTAASSASNLWMRVQLGSTGYFEGPLAGDAVSGDIFINTVFIPVLSSVSTDVTVFLLDFSSASVSVDQDLEVYGVDLGHTHGDGSYAAANHSHADGSYDINASDLNNISIGDDVSDAGSINATSVDIYLDYWNGSSWVNKHSITSTGNTLDTDVDLTDGGTYPDAAGLWRVRIDTDSASADLIQAIIKLKHALDN